MLKTRVIASGILAEPKATVGSVYFATDAWRRANRDTATRFGRALERGWLEVSRSRGYAVALAAQVTGTSRADADAQLHAERTRARPAHERRRAAAAFRSRSDRRPAAA